MRPRLQARFSAAPYIWLVAVAVVVAAGPRTVPLAAQVPTIDPDVLVRGTPAFPKIWKPYQPSSLPPVDLLNGPQLARRIVDGTLPLSLRDFLQLVVENDLDLHSARYDYAIAQARRQPTRSCRLP